MNVTSPPLSNNAPPQQDAVSPPAGTQEAPHVQCRTCGRYRHIADVRALSSVDGHVLSWICDDCHQDDNRRLVMQSPQPRSGRYTVDLMTILKAARLAHRGYGRSADDVMNRALAQYERTMQETSDVRA